MSKRKSRGVQELAARRGEFYFADGELRGGAVKRVADDGMFEGGKVHANLMRASGVELDFEKSGGTEFPENGPVCAGGAGVGRFAGRARRHFDAAFGVAGDREFDPSFCAGEFPLNKREIGLLDRAGLERFGEFGVGEIVFGDHDGSGGVFVEPMDDARAEGVAALRERLAAAEKGVDERAARIPCPGVDGHASRLVNNDEVVVFVEDVEGDRFGFGFERSTRLRPDSDPVASFEFLTGLGRPAIDQDKAGIDEFLDAGAGEFGGMGSDETIKTDTRIGWGGDKFDWVRHAAIVAG